VAFPLLIANTLDWLANESENNAPSVRAGETVTLETGATIFTRPIGSRLEQSDSVSGVFTPLLNGWYPINQGSQTRHVSVNTFNPDESNLQISSPASRSTAAPSSVTATLRWPFWRYLALCAVLLFAWEWRLFHKRHTE
jgi:hypothetical protein